MSVANLRTHLQEFYGTKTLAPDVLARLQVLAQRQAPPRGVVALRPPRSRRTLWRQLIRPMAAAAVWVVVIGALYVVARPERGAPERARASATTLAVGREIARNHHKNLAVEFAVAGYAELGAQMDKLDFTLVEPAALQARGFRLLGGRYCSVQGHLAAQLKVADPHGQVHTLYEAREVETLAAVPEGEVAADGVRVRVWREAGLFMGLASPPARSQGPQQGRANGDETVEPRYP